MPSNFALDTITNVKALMHSCKYPSETVTGVFLGSPPLSENDDIVITNYIPLFHSQTCLGPCSEAALCQVAELACINGVEVVGLFEAESQVTTVQDDPQTSGRAMAERLVSNGFKRCKYVAIDNLKLGELLNGDTEMLPFHVMSRSNQGRWARCGSKAICGDSVDTVASILKRQLALKAHYNLFDFDDHLDDIRKCAC